MKHSFIFLPLWLLAVPLLFFLHVAVIIFLPYPFSEINVLATAVVMAVIITESGAVVWWTFCLFYLFDWYTVGPFGLVLSAAVLAALVLFWLYRGILSNREFWSAAILVAVFLIFFRIFSAGFFWLRAVDQSGLIASLYRSVTVEIFVTSSFVSVWYLLLARFLPSLKVTHAKRINLYAKN